MKEKIRGKIDMVCSASITRCDLCIMVILFKSALIHVGAEKYLTPQYGANN